MSDIGKARPADSWSVTWVATTAILLCLFSQVCMATGQYETNVQIDPVFGLPISPVNFDGGGVGQYDAGASTTATCIFAAIFLSALIWGVWESLRARSAIPVCLSLSGITCVLAELNLDVMGAVVYANDVDSVVFTLMGRHMGWFVISAWSAYGGLFSLAAYKVFSRPHLRNKSIWLGLLMVCAGQTVFEELLGHFNGIYYYYGNQPLTPFTQFAWWIILPTSGGVCLLSALAYRFNGALRGWRALSLIVVAPFTFCGFMGLVSLPAWIAVNSELPWLINQLLGLTSVAAGLVAFAMIMKLILLREPLQATGKGQPF